MPSEQLVSAIVAVFNGERYLAEALESALDQTHPALELIVVDDGSSDSSLEIARNFEPRARCIEAEHGGVAAARNPGSGRSTPRWRWASFSTGSSEPERPACASRCCLGRSSGDASTGAT